MTAATPVASAETTAIKTAGSDSTAVASKTTEVILPKETKEPIVKTTRDVFVPQNKYQAKTMSYTEKYGDVKADELEFKVLGWRF